MRRPLDWEHIRKLRADNLTFKQIAAVVGINPNTLRRLARRNLRNAKAAPSPMDGLGVEDRRQALRQYFETKLQAADIPPARLPNSARTVAVIADLHGAPSPDILAALINERPHVIVVAGDLLDSYEASPHPVLPHRASPKESMLDEMRAVRAFLESLLVHTQAEILIDRKSVV